jgi:hypothetical protein
MNVKEYKSKKITLCCSLLLMCFFSLPIITAFSEESMIWTETYGGPENDVCTSMVKTDDGGFTLVGYTYSFGIADSEIWLIKIDVIGNMEWNKTYGTSGYETARDLILTDDGYIILGETTSFGAGENDIWLIKTDFSGNMQWNKTYGGIGGDRGWKIIKTSDNGYAIAGFTNSFGEGGNDYWLFKIDSFGIVQLNMTFGGIGDDRCRDIITTTDDGFLLTGWSNSYSQGDIDYWIVKTDSNGELEWNQTYGGTDTERGLATICTNDNGYLTIGNTGSFGNGGADYYLVKSDNFGNLIWNQTYGGAEAETPTSIIETTDGGYAVAGRTYSFGAGESDIWLLKIDSSGMILFNQTYGGEMSDTSQTIIQTPDGGYVIAGSTVSFGLGENDFWVIKTDEYGIIPEFPSYAVIILLLSIVTVVAIIHRKK